MKIRILPLLLAAAMLLCTACEKTTIDASFGDKRKSFNDLVIPETVELNSVTEGGNTVSQEIPASEAVLTGGAVLAGEKITGMNNPGDSITYKVSVPVGGFFDLTFEQNGDGNRVNNVAVDGVKIAEITPDEPVAKLVRLETGDHEITLTPSWGWVEFGKLTLDPTETDFAGLYNVTAGLSNENADEHTKMLYNFLCDIYGKYTLSGQYTSEGRESAEYKAITEATGESFAVLGLDIGNYTHTATANGSECKAVEYAHDWYYNAGGIVTMCWHWLSPIANVADGRQWWESFRTEASTIDLDTVMNGGDERTYEKLMDDIDDIAEQLKRLQEDGVPIIFRPLHEGSGGWFWWGNCQPDSYIKLWRTLYEKLTVEHGLNNLIWLWNGQDADWYPGDDVVDMVGWDIYPGEHEYGSFSSTFAKCADCFGENKLITLSENGCVMDPDLVYADNARWLFWGTWGGEFAVDGSGRLSEQYTELDMLKKAYSSDRTLTLDELPNLRKYRIE